MTRSTWFETKDEANAFLQGLLMGGNYEGFVRESQPKWEVKYWQLWR